MLLTRSPLSPAPKDRFSLDLHVLSAPPAFVLSQDQTLREEVVSASSEEEFDSLITLSLSSKVGPQNGPTGFRVLAGEPEGTPMRSRRLHAVEFSKTVAAFM